jgi:hypothetical protein
MTTITKTRPKVSEAVSKSETVRMRQEPIARLPLLIVGTRPLIVHAWDEKQRRAMLERHTKEAESVLEARDPAAEFEAAKYISAEGWEGVPAHGFKGALTEGSRYVGNKKLLNMTLLKGALYIGADCPATNLLRLYSPNPARMREDLVRIGPRGARVAVLRFRPEYWPWALVVTVQFPTQLFSTNQIVDLVRAAGSFNGFCEWRPGSPESLTGSYGTFEIGNAEAEDWWQQHGARLS